MTPAPIEDREIALELTYRAEMSEWLSIQPDLQYVLDPGMDPTLEDAVALSLRLEIGRAFQSRIAETVLP